METSLISVNTTFRTTVVTTFIAIALSACSTVSNIIPQLPSTGSANSTTVVGQDIAQANAFLEAGKKREAANAYFIASNNYRSPERERLILQAAELASVFNDSALTQQYLAPLNYAQLSSEYKSRFRLAQAQLALNDRNYRETLRILPQRVNDLPVELGEKILKTRMSAAQSSGDKLALVQELVLQETTLKESYEVSLNHDRIWNHAQQIPAFQLEEAKNNISHPIVKNWLSLAQLSRISKNGPANKKQTLRSDLGSWIQSNTNHPGMTKALGLLNAAPTTTVTPYSENVQKSFVIKSTVQPPVAKSPVDNKPSVQPPAAKAPPITPAVKSNNVKAPVVETPVKKDPNIKSLYENIKKQIQ